MIRELKPSDLPQLARLYRLFWNEESDLEKMKAKFQELALNSSYILLGYQEKNRLAGSVMGVICYELYGDCKPFMVLENMIVAEEARRKGVGKLLYRELENRAASAGCSQIILVTEKLRHDACAFYSSMGFSSENAGYKKKL
ncbi:MAG: GNAT family N-acetyltransferase [Peptococcaceae bacterium]|nr:GNAT family N-acetyltransferase [Peptococcaceae bacterium]